MFIDSTTALAVLNVSSQVRLEEQLVTLFWREGDCNPSLDMAMFAVPVIVYIAMGLG